MEYLKDRYRLEGLLGEGATARVYRAFDETLGVWRAVKILTVGQRRKEMMQRRLHAEARAMAKLDHPNILHLYDIGLEEERSYIIMALAERGSLQDHVDRSGPMPPQMVISYILQVLSALSAAHAAGIIHRDVKPQNVLLDVDGVAMLADFGIAMLTEEGKQRDTQTGMGMGSMAFMAPEQRLDARDVDVAADLYSVGATLFYLSTGANPIDLFAAAEDSPRWEGLDPDLRVVIQRATRYEPETRYPDAPAMAMDLIAVLRKMSAALLFESNTDYSSPALGHAMRTGETSLELMMGPGGVAATKAAISFLTEGPGEGALADWIDLHSVVTSVPATGSQLEATDTDAPQQASGAVLQPRVATAIVGAGPPSQVGSSEERREPADPFSRGPQLSMGGRRFALGWMLLFALLLAGVLWWANDYARQVEGAFSRGRLSAVRTFAQDLERDAEAALDPVEETGGGAEEGALDVEADGAAEGSEAPPVAASAEIDAGASDRAAPDAGAATPEEAEGGSAPPEPEGEESAVAGVWLGHIGDMGKTELRLSGSDGALQGLEIQSVMGIEMETPLEGSFKPDSNELEIHEQRADHDPGIFRCAVSADGQACVGRWIGKESGNQYTLKLIKSR